MPFGVDDSGAGRRAINDDAHHIPWRSRPGQRQRRACQAGLWQLRRIEDGRLRCDGGCGRVDDGRLHCDHCDALLGGKRRLGGRRAGQRHHDALWRRRQVIGAAAIRRNGAQVDGVGVWLRHRRQQRPRAGLADRSGGDDGGVEQEFDDRSHCALAISGDATVGRVCGHDDRGDDSGRRLVGRGGGRRWYGDDRLRRRSDRQDHGRGSGDDGARSVAAPQANGVKTRCVGLQRHFPATICIRHGAGGHDAVNHDFDRGARFALTAQCQLSGGERCLQQRLIQRWRTDGDGGHAHRQGDRCSSRHDFASGVDQFQRQRNVARCINGGGGRPAGVRLNMRGGE